MRPNKLGTTVSVLFSFFGELFEINVSNLGNDGRNVAMLLAMPNGSQ